VGLAARPVILSLETLSYPSPGLLKVGGNVEMLLLSSDFRFHSSSGSTPLFHGLLGLLLPSFVSELLILGVEPELFHLLLKSLSCWIVELVIGPSLKSVFLVEYDWFISCGEHAHWVLLNRFLVLLKS
jgi:hypothetical protein